MEDKASASVLRPCINGTLPRASITVHKDGSLKLVYEEPQSNSDEI